MNRPCPKERQQRGEAVGRWAPLAQDKAVGRCPPLAQEHHHQPQPLQPSHQHYSTHQQPTETTAARGMEIAAAASSSPHPETEVPLPVVVDSSAEGEQTSSEEECKNDLDAYRHEPGQCCHSILLGFLASILAWYCFGLSFFVAPYAPTDTVPPPSLVREQYQTLPAQFYLLHVGRFVGGPLFGHLGDVHDRRAAVALSLLLVALSTLALGSFPTGTHRVGKSGWTACRLLQGMGVGGQWPGTILLALEYYRDEKQGALAAAFAHSGGVLGLGLAATVAYLLLGYADGSSHGAGYGLRTAFWAGGVLLLPLSLWAYVGDQENEPFQNVYFYSERETVPCLTVVKRRFKALLFGFTTLLIDALAQTMFIYQWPILLPHGDGHHGHGCLAVGLVAMAAATVVAGYLRERCLNRCALYRVGAVLTCLFTWVWFYLAGGAVLRHKPLSWLIWANVLVLGLGVGTMQGPLVSLLVEPFPTSVAYTGLAIIYHPTHAAVAAAYPVVATWLLKKALPHPFNLGSGVDPTLLGVASLVATILCMFSASHLKGYSQQLQPLTRNRNLLVRHCIASPRPVSSPPHRDLGQRSPPTLPSVHQQAKNEEEQDGDGADRNRRRKQAVRQERKAVNVQSVYMK